MSALRFCVLTLSMLFAVACSEQSSTESRLFAGLQSANPVPGRVTKDCQIVFPADHGAHPEFAIEWWYLTANLYDDQGQRYPLQWTLFRFYNGTSATPWSDGQFYMAHASLHTNESKWFTERFARGGVGNAGVENAPFTAYLDELRWQSQSEDLFPASLNASFENASYQLTMQRTGPYVLHGNGGVSSKSASGEQASYYYSQPFIALSGRIDIDGKQIDVHGSGWFDHEWTSQYLDNRTLGWDWFSLHLNNGDKLMVFNMRNRGEQQFVTGSLITPDGQVTPLAPEQISIIGSDIKTIEGRGIPQRWQITIPDHDIDIRVTPFKADQWNNGFFSYYEGAVDVNGTHHGEGFMELTGY